VRDMVELLRELSSEQVYKLRSRGAKLKGRAVWPSLGQDGAAFELVSGRR